MSTQKKSTPAPAPAPTPMLVALLLAIATWADVNVRYAQANALQPWRKTFKRGRNAEAHALAEALRAGHTPSAQALAFAEATIAHLHEKGLPDWNKSTNARAMLASGQVTVPAEGNSYMSAVIGLAHSGLDAGLAPNAVVRDDGTRAPAAGTTPVTQERGVVVSERAVSLLDRIGITFEQLAALSPEQIAALKAIVG